MVGRICGTGAYAPPVFVSNEDLENVVDTSDTWIRERTGIARRHIAVEDTAVTMAVEAARQALADGEIDPEAVELILVSTISSERVLPCTACEVHKQLGAVHAVCFDLNAACAGFLYAYNTAQAYIRSGMYKTVLVIGTERLSQLVDWTDRNTCILFGDGAGAVVLTETENGRYNMTAHSDGRKGEALTCRTDGKIRMDGQEVFRFAVKSVPECIRELLDREQLLAEDIDYFVLHQANRRIVEAVAKRLNVPPERFPMNLEEYGNTSSASIPILLHEMKQNGMLKSGKKLVLAGFGAGLSWGASLTEW